MSEEKTKLQRIQEILCVTADDEWGGQSQAALDQEKLASKERKASRGRRTDLADGAASNGNFSTRFLKMIPFLWEWEGTKFENDLDDPGGATKFGIDQRSHPKEDIRNLTEARAKQIYWDEYWLKYDCENYAYPLGEVVFNCCVNAGWGRAKEILAKVYDDVSSETRARQFLDEMDGFYRRLADQKPRMRKFLKGWLNRTNALRKLISA